MVPTPPSLQLKVRMQRKSCRPLSSPSKTPKLPMTPRCSKPQPSRAPMLIQNSALTLLAKLRLASAFILERVSTTQTLRTLPARTSTPATRPMLHTQVQQRPLATSISMELIRFHGTRTITGLNIVRRNSLGMAPLSLLSISPLRAKRMSGNATTRQSPRQTSRSPPRLGP